MAATAGAQRRRWPRTAAVFLFFAALFFASPARGVSASACSLFARVKLDPDLSDFSALLESVGYKSSLGDERGGLGVTVLAPTNAALRAPLPRSGGTNGNNGAKTFNSSLALFSSAPAAARAAIGGHVLRGVVRDPPSDLAQGKWLRSLATAKRPGAPDRSLGVTSLPSSPGTFLLRSDTGATARAALVPADKSGGGCGGDALIKVDGVLWPYKV